VWDVKGAAATLRDFGRIWNSSQGNVGLLAVGDFPRRHFAYWPMISPAKAARLAGVFP
jgi:hypothetical protein